MTSLPYLVGLRRRTCAPGHCSVLTQAAGAVPAIFPPERFDMSKKDLIVRAKQVTERDWASGAVSRAVHDAQVATMAAVTAAVTAATTAASISAST